MIQSRTLSVNGLRFFHKYQQKSLHFDIDLLSWLSAHPSVPKCYWKSSREEEMEIAAVGEALYLSSIPSFSSDNDSPARFWGGQAFFSSAPYKDDIWKYFPKCGFFLPKIEIVKTPQKTYVIFNAINEPLDESIEIFPPFLQPEQCSLKEPKKELRYFPDFYGWSHLLRNAINHMNKKNFDKIVLARRIEMEACNLNPYFSLSKLKNTSSSTLFAIQFHQETTFLGSTPERLYKRENATLITEALAATQKRGKSKEEDLLLEKSLLEDPKLLREFSYVETSILDGLSPLVETLQSSSQKKVRKTPNIQHLCTEIFAQLKSETSDEALVKALHPTAALGGYPKQISLKLLQEKEPFERGWYGAPFGFVSQKTAEFIVAIRSILIEKEFVHLFSGAGIVKESDPLKEWEELNMKTALWEEILK